MKEYSFFGKCPTCLKELEFKFKVESELLSTGRLHGTEGLPSQTLEKLRALAGTKPDKVVAKELGVGISTVWKFRDRLKIPAAQTGTDWKEIDPLFATLSPKEISQKFSLPTATVYQRGRKIGAPKLSVETKRKKAKFLATQGLNTVEIGRVLRLSRQRIEQILKDL